MAADIRLVIAFAIISTCANGISHDLTFTESPQYSVALPGWSVYFSCQTNLKAHEETLTWWHNEVPLNSDIDNQRSLIFNISQNPAVFAEQTGSYRCIAGPKGSPFKIASREAELNIAHLDDFQDAKDEIIEIYVSNDVLIPCQVPNSVPPPFIQFEKDGRLLEEYEIINGDSLLVTNATESDSGNYTCVATNHITDERKKAAHVITLLVHNVTKNDNSRIIHQPKDNYEVKEGETVHLPCSASGVPKPDISWKKLSDIHFASSDASEESNLPVKNGLLKIKNAKLIDSGHYMCSVYNGGRKFLRRTSVTVLVPPSFTKTSSKFVSIVEGSTLRLTCSATGSPPPVISFTLNGVLIEDENYVNPASGELVIPLVQKNEQTGYYQVFIGLSKRLDCS